jgi:hypothetical protein
MNKHMRLALGLIALIMSSTAAADGILQMIINGKSFHVNSDYDWNENNYGVGLEYQFAGESRWIKTAMVNAFLDSEDNMSYMAGGGLHRRLLASDRFGGMYFDTGINVFLMSRKDINNHRPFAGLLPSVTLGNRYGGLNLSYVPKKVVHDFAHANVVDPNIDGVFFLQFKLRIDQFFTD